MAADLLTALIAANLAMAPAILIVLACRRMLRELFGARVAYAAWLLPVFAAAASFLPARSAGVLPGSPLHPAAEAAVDLAASTPASGLAAPLALSLLWAAGTLAGVLWVAVSQRRTMNLLGRLRPEEGGYLRASSPAVGPAVIGVVSPKILLPSNFEERFSEREQVVVLAHEQAHVAAWDVRINAFTVLVRCLCWFNPLVHLAARYVRIDQEMACDEAVVSKLPGVRRVYAEALLKTQLTSAPLPLGCYLTGRTPQRLRQRIVMLTREPPKLEQRLAGRALVLMLGAGVSYAAWAADPIRTPQEGRFEAAAWSGPVSAEPSSARDLAEPVDVVVEPAQALDVRLIDVGVDVQAVEAAAERAAADARAAADLAEAPAIRAEVLEDLRIEMIERAAERTEALAEHAARRAEAEAERAEAEARDVEVRVARGTGVSVLRRLNDATPDAPNVVRVQCPQGSGACVILPGMASYEARRRAEAEISQIDAGGIGLPRWGIGLPRWDNGVTVIFRFEDA